MSFHTETFYKDLLDHLFDGVYFVDPERRITYWNKGAERITGYLTAQVVGQCCRDNLLNHVDGKGEMLCLEACPLTAAMADGQVREADVFLNHQNGARVPVRVRVAPLYDEHGEIVGAVESFTTNHQTVQLQHQVRELRARAEKDKLTGVANRAAMEGKLHAALAEYQHGVPAGVLFLDIDCFKNFNDTYGHELGDKVLQMVAGTLQANVRATDVVGRWGGEEFVVLFRGLETIPHLQMLAEKLRMLVACSRLDWGDRNFYVTVSIGGTMLQSDDSLESFVGRADHFMYASKHAGRNRVTVG